MTHEPFRPVLLSQVDLEECWRHLIRPLGFRGASLWLMPIGDDDRPLGQITEITEMPEPPEGIALHGLAELLRTLTDELGIPRMAFLRSRPGAGGPSSEDLRWALALRSAAHDAGLATDVVHLATDREIVPLPLDDLPAAG
jgi:hypothetical protein